MGLHVSKHQPEARVLLLGLDGAGKSTLLYKLKYDKHFTTVPTIGFNVVMIDADKNKRKIALTVWDIGGQKMMQPHWRTFYEDTAGIIFVVDCSDRSRINEAKQVFGHTVRSDLLKGRPVVILANKQDMPGAMTAEEVTDLFGLRGTCDNRDWFIQPCSAVTGMGLAEGFQRVANLVKTTSEDHNFKETVKYFRTKSVAGK